MKVIKSKCKFCGESVTLKIDPECPDEWTAKLVPMAACNRCADWFHARDKAYQSILKIAVWLTMGNKPDERVLKALDEITRKFAAALARFQRKPQSAWTPAFPKAIVDKPEKWVDTFHDFIRLRQPASPSEPQP